MFWSGKLGRKNQAIIPKPIVIAPSMILYVHDYWVIEYDIECLGLTHENPCPPCDSVPTSKQCQNVCEDSTKATNKNADDIESSQAVQWDS